jgi:hypothetical protein
MLLSGRIVEQYVATKHCYDVTGVDSDNRGRRFGLRCRYAVDDLARSTLVISIDRKQRQQQQ